MQDLLGKDNSARMNTPGVAAGNWAWRYQSWELNDDMADRLRETCILFGRTGGPAPETEVTEVTEEVDIPEVKKDDKA